MKTSQAEVRCRVSGECVKKPSLPGGGNKPRGGSHGKREHAHVAAMNALKSVREVLGSVGLVVAVVAMLVCIESFVPNSWVKRNFSSMTFSAELSIGLTMAAIGLAVAIYRRQAIEAGKTEDRAWDRASYFHENVLEVLHFTRRANEMRGGEAPSNSLERRYEDELARWLTDASASVKQVLWVDDKLESVAWERRALQCAGVSVVGVENSTDAIALMQCNSFDLVITDVRRPEGAFAGLELAYRITKEGILGAPAIPVLMYSSSSTPAQEESARRNGASGQYSSPYELLIAVLAHLKN